jgi:hypothetical protein
LRVGPLGASKNGLGLSSWAVTRLAENPGSYIATLVTVFFLKGNGSFLLRKGFLVVLNGTISRFSYAQIFF